MQESIVTNLQSHTDKPHAALKPLDTGSIAAPQVAEGSPSVCEKTCKQLVPKLAAAAAAAACRTSSADQQQSPEAAQQIQHLALTTLLAILQAAGRLAATGACQQDPLAGTGSTMFQAVSAGPVKSPRSQIQSEVTATENMSTEADSSIDTDKAGRHAAVLDQSLQQLAGSISRENGSHHATSLDTEALQLLRLQVLTELVSLPATLRCLSTEVDCCSLPNFKS